MTLEGVVPHGEISLVDGDGDVDDGSVNNVDVDLNISVVPHGEKHQITRGAIGTSATEPGNLVANDSRLTQD